MRFFKSKIILLSSFLVVGLFNTPTQADNANPPKITDVVEVSKGPYKPGDLITIKVVYTGGNPGLDWVRIGFSGCLQEMSWYDYHGVSDNHGNGIVSGSVPTCPPGIYKVMTAYIRDKTGLNNIWYNSFSTNQVEISDFAFKPVKIGEIAPSVLQSHKLDISSIPLNPNIGDVFVLPAVTSVGMPVYYDDVADDSCSLSQDKFGNVNRPGGTLKINNYGKCNLRISADNGTRFSNQKPTFSQPLIASKVAVNVSGNTNSVVYEIRDASKANQVNKVLVCKKGKLVKKIKGINPKCPSGYKKA